MKQGEEHCGRAGKHISREGTGLYTRDKIKNRRIHPIYVLQVVCVLHQRPHKEAIR